MDIELVGCSVPLTRIWVLSVLEDVATYAFHDDVVQRVVAGSFMYIRRKSIICAARRYFPLARHVPRFLPFR